MKKFGSIIITLVIFFSALIFYYFKFIYKNDLFKIPDTRTPVAFLSQVVVTPDRYTADSMLLLEDVKAGILSDKLTFYGHFNHESGLIIDTIVYSPDQQKVAVLILVKNPTSQLEKYPKEYKWYYSGHCFIGKRGTNSFSIKSYGGFVQNNFDEWELSDQLKEGFFDKWAGRQGGTYNLNDRRFWNDHFWNE